MTIISETNDEKKYTKFQIKQTHHIYGDPRYRKQTINIAFFDNNGGLIEKFERVNIENQEITELEMFKDKKEPAAILLNSDDWGFGHFNLDEASLKVFENQLSKISSKIDKSVICGQLVCMMREIEYPATRLVGIMRQLMDEKNQHLVDSLFAALNLSIQQYLPLDEVTKFRNEAADFFL